MKVLVVGGGGREHALVRKIKESKKVDEIFCTPGNGGISYDAKTDRWYYENTNGSIHEWVSGDVLRNVAVDKVTTGIAQETKDRLASVSSESSSQKAADASLQKSIDEISQNAIRYTDDTHSSISLRDSGTALSHLKDGTVAAIFKRHGVTLRTH